MNKLELKVEHARLIAKIERLHRAVFEMEVDESNDGSLQECFITEDKYGLAQSLYDDVTWTFQPKY